MVYQFLLDGNGDETEAFIPYEKTIPFEEGFDYLHENRVDYK